MVILISNNCSFIVGKEKMGNGDVFKEHFKFWVDGALILLSNTYVPSEIKLLNVCSICEILGRNHIICFNFNSLWCNNGNVWCSGSTCYSGQCTL
jgi:hypothetical protein